LTEKRNAYAALRESISGLMATELVLRDEHALAVDRIRGQVRAAFPGDRALWRVIFPSPVSSARRPALLSFRVLPENLWARDLGFVPRERRVT
jgi:hypothetical protein